MREWDWKRIAAITVSVFGVLAALYLLARYLLVLLLPFLIALALAVATRRVTLALCRRLHCSWRVGAILVTLGALLLASLGIFIICNRLVSEAQNLLDFLVRDSEDPDGQVARLVAFFRDLGGRLPLFSKLGRLSFIREMLGDPEEYLVEAFQRFLTGITDRFAAFAAALLRRLPGVLLFLLFTVISCFYFSVEYDTVARTLLRLLPLRAREGFPAWRARAAFAAKRYLRAYCLLFLLTLFELSVGFFLLRVRSPFLLALLIAILDILPVLGVGVVLLPFAVFCFATGAVVRGVGLCVLYVLITVVRQIAEPHLVGKSIGLHPILMLISLYVGLGLFGVMGFLIGPLVALGSKALFSRNKEKGTP